jgi:hypothetical protein
MIGSKPYFPASDGNGCPACGAIYPGGHGGYCPYGRHFDEDGKEVSVAGKTPVEQIEADLRDMRKP